MADWYVSSAVYATIPAWAATTAYTVGQIIKPLTVPAGTAYVYRCTTAGTTAGTEPGAWLTGNNITTTSGTAVFTNVTGQSAYGWAAAAGTLLTLTANVGARILVGDRVLLSSDHSENTSGSAGVTYSFNSSAAAFGVIQIVSVNRAGSVPPTASDTQFGAAITNTGTSGSPHLFLEAHCNLFWQGITFTLAGTGTALSLLFNNATVARKSHYLKNCTIALTTALAAARITSNNVAKVTLDNTTIQFGATGQAISCNTPFDFNWINTPSAIVGATIPTTLFACGTNAPPLSVTCRGVDLSAVAGTLCGGTTATNGGSMKALFDSCRIAAGVTRLATPATITNAGDEVELANCYNGTNIINERYAYGGSVIIDRSTTLSGGAQDDVGGYSLKLASSTRADFQTMPLDAFWLDVENTAISAAKTATVEVIASASLNNADIRLQFEHMGTSGSSLSSFVENLASVLTVAAALPTSPVTWLNPPATPVKQQLQATFTPRTVGRVRGLVRLGKTSATVWVNPQIAIANATDPFFSSVKLLMGFDGAAFTDESSALHGTATVTGGAQISTAQSVFGGSSLLLDGSSGYLSYPDHADWAFTNGRFTVECRIRPTDISSLHFIIGQWSASGNLGWQMWHNSASLEFVVSDDGTANRTLASTTIAANTWYAVAFDFDGTKYRLYVNGVMVSSSTTLYTILDSSNPMLIGANNNASFRFYYIGNIDEMRITKGVARYASDSGYAVATAAFPRA